MDRTERVRNHVLHKLSYTLRLDICNMYIQDPRSYFEEVMQETNEV